jgi:hypothetical protein
MAVALAGLLSPTGWGQQPDVPLGYNERKIEQKDHPQDARDAKTNQPAIWTLDFHFKDPRVIPVDIPGRGRRLVWYLWYQVANNTGQARTFVPDFVWVCNETQTAYHDQVLLKAQAAIQRLEAPSGQQEVKNSWTIAATDGIPYVRQFNEKNERVAYPRMVTSVATWDDIDPKCTQFSIYVYGLSDGWAAVDGPDGKPVVRRKTLKLTFKRLGDDANQETSPIRFLGHEWVYATSEMPPGTTPARKPEEKEKAGPDRKPAPLPGREAAKR